MPALCASGFLAPGPPLLGLARPPHHDLASSKPTVNEAATRAPQASSTPFSGDIDCFCSTRELQRKDVRRVKRRLLDVPTPYLVRKTPQQQSATTRLAASKDCRDKGAQKQRELTRQKRGTYRNLFLCWLFLNITLFWHMNSSPRRPALPPQVSVYSKFTRTTAVHALPATADSGETVGRAVLSRNPWDQVRYVWRVFGGGERCATDRSKSRATLHTKKHILVYRLGARRQQAES